MISQSFVRDYGKGIGAALLAMLMMTLVMLVLCLLVVADALEGDVLGGAFAAFFGAMGLVGGGTQLPNAAERLPGERKWDMPHRMDQPQNRRREDMAAQGPEER